MKSILLIALMFVSYAHADEDDRRVASNLAAQFAQRDFPGASPVVVFADYRTEQVISSQPWGSHAMGFRQNPFRDGSARLAAFLDAFYLVIPAAATCRELYSVGTVSTAVRQTLYDCSVKYPSFELRMIATNDYFGAGGEVLSLSPDPVAVYSR